MSPDILLSQAIRERCARAAWEARRKLHGWQLSWEHISPERREECLVQADAVAQELWQIIVETLKGDEHADHAPADHLV